MTSFLNKQLAKAIGVGFKGKTFKALLVKTDTSTTTTKDANGDPINPSTSAYPGEGFTANYSDYARGTYGIPVEDVEVNLFAALLPSGIRPNNGDVVRLMNVDRTEDVWYTLSRLSTDPASAVWLAQGTLTQAPEGY